MVPHQGPSLHFRALQDTALLASRPPALADDLHHKTQTAPFGDLLGDHRWRRTVAPTEDLPYRCEAEWDHPCSSTMVSP